MRYYRQEHAGRAAALNLGCKNSRGNIVLFIDSHGLLDASCLDEHYKAHLKTEGSDVALVFGHLALIGDIANFGRKDFSATKQQQKWMLKHEQDPFRACKTGNVSIRKTILEKIGGFDEDFKGYGFEDAEFGLRLKKAGYRFKANWLATIYVFSLHQTLAGRCQKMREAGHNAVLFRKKHPWIGLQLVNPISRSAYYLYTLFGQARLKQVLRKLRLSPDNKLLQNKLRNFCHSLGIAEALHPKLKLPTTEELLALN